jgi:hypothetical protein
MIRPTGLKQDHEGRFYILGPTGEITVPMERKAFSFKLLHTFYIDRNGVATVERCDHVECLVCKEKS